MKAFIVNAKDTERFDEVELDKPVAKGRDILVKVEAVSINPVDTKVRRSRAGRVLGWDASGVVAAVGDEVKGFSVGDQVYYAGDITRDGTNAQYHLVDERIVGKKPKSLDHVGAAALPLTALTAWEGLYEQLRLDPGQRSHGGRILVINSAGGVGSLVVQMAKKLSGLEVIGTASRPESAEWSRRMGADHVIDHRGDMPKQLEDLGLAPVDYIFCCHDTHVHFDAMTQMIGPEGTIVSIVESEKALPISKLMSKKATFTWELMFTKAMYKTRNMDTQRQILDKVASLIDAGTLTCTQTRDAGELSAGALENAHREIATQSMIGKLVFRMPA